MRCGVAVSVVLAFAVLAVAALDPPQTLQRFSGNFEQSLSIGAQLGVSADTVKRHLDTLHLSSYRSAVDEWEKHRETIAKKRGADALTVAISAVAKGEGQFDVKNNLMLQTINDLYFDFSGALQIDLKHVDATSLIMFDLGKNYTWNGDICLCQPIQGPQEMPLYYVPPYATIENPTTTIEINGENVQVAEWAAEFSVGFNFPSLLPPYLSPNPKSATTSTDQPKPKTQNVDDGIIGDLFSMTFYIYVDPANFVRRVVFSVKLGIPGFNTFVNTTTDFWNVQVLNDNQLVIPDNKCYNVCKAAVDTVTKYVDCIIPSGNCLCPVKADVNFCSDVVTYPVCKTVFQLEADLYVNSSFGSLSASLSAAGAIDSECLSQLKEFLCRFYLPQCSSSGDYVKPDLNETLPCFYGSFNASGNINGKRSAYTAPSDAQKEIVSNDVALSSYETAAGRTRKYAAGTQLVAWQIALIAVGSALFVAIVVVVVVVIIRKRKARYQAL